MKQLNKNIRFNNSASGVDDIAIIDVNGCIGLDWWTGEGFTKETIMNEIKGRTLKEIHFNLSSYGGDYAEALAIKNMAVSTGATIYAHYFGLNASAVTEIGNAASKENTTISADAYGLIHNTSTYADGSKEQILKVVDTLAKFDEGLAKNYAAKSGVKTAEEFAEQMKKDQWMNADEFVAWGLAGKTTTAQPVSASARLEIRNAVEKKLLTLPPDYKVEEPKIDNIMDFKAELKEQFTAFANVVKEAIAALKPVIKNEMKKTKDGKSVYYTGDLAVGTKVYDDEAMTVPCVDGEYIIDANTYTVANGEVTMVTPYVDPAAENATAEALAEEQAKVADLTEKLAAVNKEIETVKANATKHIQSVDASFTEFKNKLITGEEWNPELVQTIKGETEKENKPTGILAEAAERKRKQREEAAAAKK